MVYFLGKVSILICLTKFWTPRLPLSSELLVDVELEEECSSSCTTFVNRGNFGDAVPHSVCTSDCCRIVQLQEN